LAPCPASGLIVHGDKDELVAIEDVNKLAAKLKSQKNIVIDYEVIQGCDHLFTKHMKKLNRIIEDYLDKSLEQAA
ncbi:MAG: prolyl oligopeptidase family serine peptidase, partial [Rhodospirillaceae bacterium]|nr:prolyl oligopeptidase family serine peptidase [Rhodospirillaceae bacterium]